MNRDRPEIWLDIAGYEGLYQVSDMGNVRRVSVTTKLSLIDVNNMRQLRQIGWTFKEIADRFGVTKHAVIVALDYRYKNRSLREPYRIIRAQKSSAGYAIVSLCKKGLAKSFPIHRLVTQAFLGPCPDGHEVNHKNGFKIDPRLDNLEYVTRSQNALHSVHILGNWPKTEHLRKFHRGPGPNWSEIQL